MFFTISAIGSIPVMFSEHASEGFKEYIVPVCLWIANFGSSGNFSKLTTPYDPDGKGCGIDHPDHPFIYFAEPTISVIINYNVDSLENSLRKIMS